MARAALTSWLPRHPALRWSVIGLSSLVGTLVLLFALMQTPPGKWAVAKLASSMASSNGLTIEFSDVTGWLPWNVKIGKVTLSDAQGVFAQANGLQVDWRPLRLLSGEVAIDNLQASQIDVQRRPVLPPQEPLDLSHTIINRIAVDKISIDDAIWGAKAELSLNAAVNSTPALTSVTFDVQRHDAAGAIKGTASFAPSGKILDIDVTAHEPAGGVLAHALNIDGAPEFHAALQGHGSLDQWDGTLAIKAGPNVHADGIATIRTAPGGHRVTVDLNGAIAKILSADLAPLFEGNTQVKGAALVSDKALIGIETFTAASAGFDMKLGGSFDAQAFLANLTFELQAKGAQRYAALLPSGAGFAGLTAKGTISGAPEMPSIAAVVTANDIAVSGYRIASLTANLKTTPDSKGLVIALDGQADGLTASDPAVSAALGGSAHVTASGTYSTLRQIDITSVALNGPSAEARFDGHATLQAIAGKLHIARFDLALAAPLAGRKLAGQVVLDAAIDSSADVKRFALDLDGHIDNFSSDMPSLDGLLAPSLKVNGRVTRNADGAFTASNLKASSGSFDATFDGQLDKGLANLKTRVHFTDLAKLDPRLAGDGTASADFSGTLDKLNVQAALAIPKGKAMGRDVENLTLSVNAKDVTGAVTGDIKLDGSIGGKPATGNATIAGGPDGTRQLNDFALSIGSVNGKGSLTQNSDGKLKGAIVLKAGNLDDLAPLTLTELAGQLEATIKFDTDKDVQRIVVDGTASGIRVPGTTVGSARVKLTVLDPSGAPQINGTAELANVRSGSLAIDKASFTATNSGDATDLRFTATALGAAIDGAGKLVAKDGVSTLSLSALKIVKDSATATLAGPASIVFDRGTTKIDRLALNANGGGVTIQGTVGNALNLTVELRSLPLSLLALAMPEADVSGTVSGTIKLTGSSKAPSGQYELTINKAGNTRLARGGIGPFDGKAKGTLSGNKVTIDANITAPSLKGITVVGTIPLDNGSLDLAIKGQAGLNLINTALATSGSYAAGTMNIDATVKGTRDAPLASGTIRIADGRFSDAINGMSFDKITAEIVAEGRQITIRSFTAHTAGDGTVQAQGSVTLDPQAGFPGNVQITLQKARLLSNETVRLVADAKLSLTGAFATRPNLSGTIDVRNLDINIPDSLPGSISATEVRHINVPDADKAEIQTPQTKAKAKRDAENKTRPAAAPMVANLDLTISAPNRVFVRGRGMNAEFGGTVKITGTSAKPVSNGGFDLRHGDLDVLDRHLKFSRGKILFHGTTDPELDFAADSQSGGITATVRVTGLASAPVITFTSTPVLPEDEVLARLLFGKTSGSLTPGQAIQVARAIQQFSGSSGSRRLDDVRRSLGVNSLDIGTGPNGSGGQVGIGKRLNDNVYLGVSQGTAADSSQVTVDVDVTKNIKVTGKGGAAGGEVGIGAEWDY